MFSVMDCILESGGQDGFDKIDKKWKFLIIPIV